MAATRTKTAVQLSEGVTLILGDCLPALPALAAVHSIVTDPPYGWRFMARKWDHDVPGVAVWQAALHALKPGGHVLAACGPRTQHRMACAIEDAGFEIRDALLWIYGSGFPKSLNIGKAIDKAAGAVREVVGVHKRHGGGSAISGSMAGPLGTASDLPSTAPSTDAAKQWEGWGTGLKPACEFFTLARKPIDAANVAANILKHGVGGLNIDGCRVGTEVRYNAAAGNKPGGASLNMSKVGMPDAEGQKAIGRWPANVIHDGSQAVLDLFPVTKSASGGMTSRTGKGLAFGMGTAPRTGHEDEGSAARFFYCAKASQAERGEGNDHPTVKPVALMRYLCRLITPPGGTVIDPFMGSGSTGIAAIREGFRFIGIERDLKSFEIARRRLEAELGKQGGVTCCQK